MLADAHGMSLLTRRLGSIGEHSTISSHSTHCYMSCASSHFMHYSGVHTVEFFHHEVMRFSLQGAF